MSSGKRSPHSRSSCRAAGGTAASWQTMGNAPASGSGDADERSLHTRLCGNQSIESSAARCTIIASPGHRSLKLMAVVNIALTGRDLALPQLRLIEETGREFVEDRVEPRARFAAAGRRGICVEQHGLALMDDEVELAEVEAQPPPRLANGDRNFVHEFAFDDVLALHDGFRGNAEQCLFARAEEHPCAQAIEVIAPFREKFFDDEPTIQPYEPGHLADALVDRVGVRASNIALSWQQPIDDAGHKSLDCPALFPPSIEVWMIETIVVGLNDDGRTPARSALDEVRADMPFRNVTHGAVDYARIAFEHAIICRRASRAVDMHDADICFDAAFGIIDNDDLDAGVAPPAAQK